nr:hypothetical protein GCM10020092_031310 [Actinoplanes digitatis]
MTAPNPTTAVLTPSITNLLPRAVDLAIERGGLPPLKQLMTHLRIGRPKASLVRDALARVNWETVRLVIDHQSESPAHVADVRRIALESVTNADESGPAPHLHVVPDVPQDLETETEETYDPGVVTPVPNAPNPDDRPAEAGPAATAPPDTPASAIAASGQVAAEITEVTREAVDESAALPSPDAPQAGGLAGADPVPARVRRDLGRLGRDGTPDRVRPRHAAARHLRLPARHGDHPADRC